MAKRQKEWARRVRDDLFAKLGNTCHDCNSIFDLQLDCDEPRGDDHHRRMAWDTRMSFYKREYEAGNLRLRCKFCNGSKGGTVDKAYHQAQRQLTNTGDR